MRKIKKRCWLKLLFIAPRTKWKSGQIEPRIINGIKNMLRALPKHTERPIGRFMLLLEQNAVRLN